MRDFATRRVEHLERSKGPDHADLIPALVRRADLALVGSDVDAADADNQRALAIAEASQGAGSAVEANLRLRRGAALLVRGRHQAALAEFRKARAIGRARRRDDPVGHATTWLAIARAHAEAGADVRAWWACRSALKAIIQDRGRLHPDTATVLEAIARHHAGRTFPGRAAPLFKRRWRSVRRQRASTHRRRSRRRSRSPRPTGHRAASAVPRRPTAGSNGRSRRGSGPITPRSALWPWGWRRR